MRVRETIVHLERHLFSLRRATFAGAASCISCPEFEAKVLFARHVWRDATAALRVAQRLGELGAPPAEAERRWPAIGVKNTAEKLAFMSHARWELSGAIEAHAFRIDPLADEPTRLLLTDLLTAQRALLEDLARTKRELGVGHTEIPSFDEAAIESVPRHPALDERLRHGKFSVAPDPDLRKNAVPLMHMMMTDVEIGTTETCARIILESPGMPWDFVIDMARQCWDEARHAILFRQRIEDLGGHFGQFPASNFLWEIGVGQPVDLRLCVQQCIGEWSGVEGAYWHARKFEELGDEMSALVWDYVAEDEIAHVGFGNKWLKYCAGSEQAVQDIHARALALRQAHGRSLEQKPRFPFSRQACERAGFSSQAVRAYEERAELYGSVHS